MNVAVPSSSARRLGHRTAFERNMLAGFAGWFAEQVELLRPDYLIPAETKGARLLETVLAYARDVLGRPIDVPVLYVTALAYMDPSVLRGSRVLIVDDAVKTGANLARHRRRVESFGATHVKALACVGYADAKGDMPPAPCYRIADGERYSDYVWQLTELVVARGLPPEVDHHVFELRLPGRLPVALRWLEAALRPYGQVTRDAASEGDEDIVGITLHFPRLPETRTHPTEGEIRSEGVSKIRFFPDLARDCVHVVPVSFPALELPSGDPLSETDARERIRRWAHREGGIGDVLVAEAHTRDPEMVFRALSTCTEVDLVSGLARVLARTFGAAAVGLEAQRELFQRLYGEEAGERIAAHVDGEVRAVLEGGGDRVPAEQGELPLLLDRQVVATTKEIAIGLKDLYAERVRTLGREPAERVGCSLSEIASTLPDASDLLISRCLDHGLAMTTLVPYVDAEPRPDGSVLVQRKYRVSETQRATTDYADIDDVNRQLSEETVALIAHYLRTHSAGHGDRPVPQQLITQLAAILRPLVLAECGVSLHVRPSPGAPRLILRDGPFPPGIDDKPSAWFKREDDGIVPTEAFEDRYERDRLLLDMRGCSLPIESWLDLLVRFVDDGDLSAEQRDAVLASWAMSADGHLGLTHVRAALDRALDALRTPINLMLRGEEHEPSPNAAAAARGHAEEAVALAQRLRTDWAGSARNSWPHPSKRDRRLLASMGTSTEDTVFEIPAALAAMVVTLSRLVELLEAASLRLGGGGEQADAAYAAAELVLARCAAIERVMTSLRDDDGNAPTPAGTPRAAVAGAANALLRVDRLLHAFAAATVGAFGGIDGTESEADPRERTVLFADLAGSLKHALEHDGEVDARWKNAGLNLVAQWGKAFGGWERQDRQGDAIWLELPSPGDPAVLCAAAVQLHARALRSTGIASVRWGFYVAVDHGRLRDGDGRNNMGLCLDRASALAKVHKQDADATLRVFVTPETSDLCSATLREPPRMTDFGEQVVLADVDHASARFVPRRADPEAIMAYWCERVRAEASALGSVPQDDVAEAPIRDIGADAAEAAGGSY